METQEDPKWKAIYNLWKYHIGITNGDNEPITAEGLEKWTKDPKREYQCIFCGGVGQMEVEGYRCCPGCREYKGIIPYIE